MNPRVIFASLIVAFSTCAWAQSEGGGVATPVLADAGELLDQATRLFDQATALNDDEPGQAEQLFEQAMIRYDAIVEQHGIRNTELLLNLGNASMLAGDSGRAVLAYRRAQRLSPSDTRVQRSLAQARSRVAVEMEASAGARLRQALLAWRGVIPRSVLSGIALGGYLLLWTLAFLRLFSVAPWSRSLLIPSIAATGLSLGLLLYEQRTIAGSNEAVVSRDTRALNGPSEGVYEPTFDHDLPAGVEVFMLERRGGWVRIQLIDGRETWVRESALWAV